MSLYSKRKDELISIIEKLSPTELAYLRQENERLELSDTIRKNKIKCLEMLITDQNDNKIYMKSQIKELTERLWKLENKAESTDMSAFFSDEET